jgi:hypothetical protein
MIVKKYNSNKKEIFSKYLDMDYAYFLCKENIPNFKKFTEESKARIEELINSDDIISYTNLVLLLRKNVLQNDNRSKIVDSKIYWLYRGYSIKESSEIVNKIQKTRSMRSKEYGIKKGRVR